MQSFKFPSRSLRARLAGAVFALVASLSVVAAVFAVFAEASDELDPMKRLEGALFTPQPPRTAVPIDTQGDPVSSCGPPRKSPRAPQCPVRSAS
jgi:hypothetical protein